MTAPAASLFDEAESRLDVLVVPRVDVEEPLFRPEELLDAIEVVVADSEEPDYVLARLAGYLGQPPQR
mgnify:CR=1 FL=1